MSKEIATPGRGSDKLWRGKEEVLLLSGFVVGIAMGIWGYFGGRLGERLSLDSVVWGYTRVLEGGGGDVSFFAVWLDLLRWPFLAWILGWFGIGKLFLPVVFGARGFLLAFAACALAQGGMSGLTRFLILGFGALFSIPVFFLLGTQSLRQTRGVGLSGSIAVRDFPKRFWVLTAVTVAALALCAGAETRLIPPLLRAWTGLER